MNNHTVWQKRVGETPLQALERFRASEPALADIPMTYAGRLDPMASGELIFLIGDECKHRENYDSLDKTYRFEILFGVESDTGDTLGLASDATGFRDDSKDWEQFVASFVGSHHLPYPVFSSRTVDGKPLFEHAHRDAGVERPIREMRVIEASYVGARTIASGALLYEIEQKLSLLNVPESNDFRTDRIVPRWHDVLSKDTVFTILTVEAIVTSGTYIRALAPHFAQRLGTKGLAYSIHRTAIHLTDR